MKSIPDNSFHSVITDPPYGLTEPRSGGNGTGQMWATRSDEMKEKRRGGFMGKGWDHAVPGVLFWQEILRVSKPGAHLLAFGGTRTHHRLMVAIEDAGWEIRDCMMWLYGSGMPKSRDISKAIDKEGGFERDVVGIKSYPREGTTPVTRKATSIMGSGSSGNVGQNSNFITAPTTDEAKQWDGWGTGLTPSWEPIILARKPISEKTIADNVLRWGTGAINIDACRIETLGKDKEKHLAEWDRMQSTAAQEGRNSMNGGLTAIDLSSYAKEGRWPKNVILDEEAGKMLPNSKGQQGDLVGHNKKRKSPNGVFGEMAPATDHLKREDSGSAARFFYCSKTSKSDRGEGNTHATVKPTDLMRYLCRLITPPNGIVFDPFMGSGSTGKAALLENFRFYGIEKEKDYLEIAQKRIENAAQQLGK